jgi:GNAT superfamily N-acetyltransferase
MTIDIATRYDVRPYVDADERAVLELLNASLGGGPAGIRPPEFFRWKHLANVWGRSLMLVAHAEDRIIGFRAFMRWRFMVGDRTVPAVRAVDTATHPDWQGRGVFSRLTSEALNQLRAGADFVFNTPNDKSGPGYIKLGWQPVGTVPVAVRIRRPIRFATGLFSGSPPSDGDQFEKNGCSAPPFSSVTWPDEELDALFAHGSINGRLRTDKGAAYLRWRYGAAPLLDYRTLTAHDGDGLSGVVVFRLRQRGRLSEASVTELVVRPGDRRTARSLLRAAALSSNADHLTCSFLPGTIAGRAAAACGFLRSPRGIRLVANPLGRTSDPDPAQLRSWDLTIGDLEVF